MASWCWSARSCHPDEPHADRRRGDGLVRGVLLIGVRARILGEVGLVAYLIPAFANTLSTAGPAGRLFTPTISGNAGASVEL